MKKPHLTAATRATYATFAAVLAVSASAAHAQSNVQLYGLLDLSVSSTQAPGGRTTKTVDNGKMTTSHLGFKGSEELGDGLKAIFVLEHFLRADTGAAGRFDGDVFWARNAFVGLTGSFGTLTAGRHTTPRFGGAVITLSAAPGEGNGGRNTGATISYSEGSLAGGLSWQKVEKGSTVQDSTTWQAAGSYDFTVAKLFAQYGSVKNDSTGRSYDISDLGVSVPVGAGKALLQYGQISPSTGAKRTTVSAGYDYTLSKRTDVYGVVMSDKISGLSTGNNFSVGVRHRF